MHEPSFLPGKPTDETPGKGQKLTQNLSWQPFSLEIPSAVPAERHLKRMQTPKGTEGLELVLKPFAE